VTLFSADAATCDAALCSRYATVVTPEGLACDACCPPEHKPSPGERNVLARVDATLQEAGVPVE
jgi:hypothetical protein